MKTNYVLIDYENVQPTLVSLLDQEHFKVLVFVGYNQTKIAFDVAASLQSLGSRAQYLKVTGGGANALDFHIAFYIGQLTIKEPNAYFHIISKDTGYDPLVQHLRKNNIFVCRVDDIKDIPIVRASMITSFSEKTRLVIDDLQKRGAAKPKTVQTLSSTIGAIFQKKISEEEIASLVCELQKARIIAINDANITYLS